MIYDVPTKRLNEQVKRNFARFPEDFVFQLTSAEKQEVVANCNHLARLKAYREGRMEAISFEEVKRDITARLRECK
ncbi:MAG: ORF6N domain-containing protein [Spartobacteria bacterium]